MLLAVADIKFYWGKTEGKKAMVEIMPGLIMCSNEFFTYVLNSIDIKINAIQTNIQI